VETCIEGDGREYISPNLVIERLVVLFSIQQITNSHLGPNPAYPDMILDFTQFLHENAGVILESRAHPPIPFHRVRQENLTVSKSVQNSKCSGTPAIRWYIARPNFDPQDVGNTFLLMLLYHLGKPDSF
jgi:hypothetical protein